MRIEIECADADRYPFVAQANLDIMAAKAKSGGNLDIKAMMKTFEGRWIWIPLFIVIAALVGTALVLGMLQLDKALPPIASTAPAGIAALLYYGVQLRKLFGSGSTRVAVMNRSDGVGVQDVSDHGVAPVIKGDNNTVTVIHSTPSKPRTKKTRKSDGSIKAGGSITAGKDIKASGSIDAGENIEAGRDKAPP